MPAKLVAIGDSLTQGFLNGSISQTHLSYPAMIARCLGETDFKVPDFAGEGGLPVNLETLFQMLAVKFGEKIGVSDSISAFLATQGFLDRVEDYWERGEGTQATQTGPVHHNLAVWGFALGNCDTLTEATCRRFIPIPKDHTVNQIPEFAMYRTARRTLNPSFDAQYENLSQLSAAAEIAKTQGGIENLIFWLGSNNCLSTVTNLKIKWSEAADLDLLAHQRSCNLWLPSHFRTLLWQIADKIDAIGAKNVFIATIPHVTIPPVSRGITPGATEEQKLSEDGYYEYYTHFWIWDEDFANAPDKYPHLTRDQARTIDAAINEYNEAIKLEANKRGWHLVDICNRLDRLAYRRQKRHTTYEFPKELVAALKSHPATKERFTSDGKPILDTRYLRLYADQTNPEEKYRGGIFSLDGIHPTTTGYGIVAHEFLQVMEQVLPAKPKPLNWQEIISADTLLLKPPENLQNLREMLNFMQNRTLLPNLIKVISG
ncbi:SGNH/GDSL hydrolase family protein [Microseira sp. BLCC-F43]|jgi:hypothetical protein|uniref:SGNH/GDSL hydrolase family protein n=1 Tax=Microseira sp. BLCC-F43 TaxID=3153602 RepID=UPI0035B6CFE0